MTEDARDPETTAMASDPVSPGPADELDHEPTHLRVPTRQPKPGSKTHQLIRLLSGKTGADVLTISQKLGWQAHTTRAAITGLRKAGHPIDHVKGVNGKPGRYRITGPVLRLGG